MADLTQQFFYVLLEQQVRGKPVDFSVEQLAEVNEALFLHLAHEHRVLLLVNAAFHQASLGHLPLAQKLKKIALKKIPQQLLMMKCLMDLVELLQAQDIAYTVLKGAPLNRQLYGDALYRTSHDIDILIHVKDLMKTHALLLDRGYVLIYGSPPEQLVPYPELLALMKDLVYRHEKWRVVVELHWNITQMPTLNFVQMSEQQVVLLCSLHEKAIPTLPLEENFLYLCLHAALHSWTRLMWLIDIAQFYQKFPLDWSRLLAMAQQYHCVRPLLEARYLLSKQFHLTLPFISHTRADRRVLVWRLRYVNYLWRLKVRGKSEHTYQEVLSSSFLLPTFKHKWHYLCGLLLQGTDGLQQLRAKPERSKALIILFSLLRKLPRLVRS